MFIKVYILFTSCYVYCTIHQHIIYIYTCINTLDLKTKDPAGGGSELMTDSNIQRKNLSYLDGRELETASAWLSSDTATNTTGTTLTLEKEYSNSSGGASNKPWNQVG